MDVVRLLLHRARSCKRPDHAIGFIRYLDHEAGTVRKGTFAEQEAPELFLVWTQRDRWCRTNSVVPALNRRLPKDAEAEISNLLDGAVVFWRDDVQGRIRILKNRGRLPQHRQQFEPLRLPMAMLKESIFAIPVKTLFTNSTEDVPPHLDRCLERFVCLNDDGIRILPFAPEQSVGRLRDKVAVLKLGFIQAETAFADKGHLI
jgi:hypothetical protein